MDTLVPLQEKRSRRAGWDVRVRGADEWAGAAGMVGADAIVEPSLPAPAFPIMSARELAELFEELPAEARSQLERLAEKLRAARRTQKPTGDYSFDWAGGLKEFRDQYTSVELQHKASEWRLES